MHGIARQPFEKRHTIFHETTRDIRTEKFYYSRGTNYLLDRDLFDISIAAKTERERERGRSDDLKGSRMGFDGVEIGWKFGNFAGFDAKRGGK